MKRSRKFKKRADSSHFNPRPGIMTLRKPKKRSTGNVAQSTGHWENEPKDVSEFVGFVYRITNKTNGKFYIGKKLFWRSRAKKGNRKTFEESDWRRYYGSCKELVDDVRALGKENFRREILSVHKMKSEMAAIELLHQLHECFKGVPTYNGIINVRLRFNSHIAKAVQNFFAQRS